MRQPFDPQQRLGCPAIEDVSINTKCRDEIIPILRALQHLYSKPTLRDQILSLIAADLNGQARADRGRAGMTYWQVLVLLAVRLGCNLNYDKLQNLAEEHRTLREIMGIMGWDNDDSFDWRRIWDNVTRVRPATIEKINHAVVAAGHEVAPAAAETVRGDSFVVETNIHYPTDSWLIADGLRNVLKLVVLLAGILGPAALRGWRQHRHLRKQISAIARRIRRIAGKKGPNYRDRLATEYRQLLELAQTILDRASELVDRGLKARGGLSALSQSQIGPLLEELTYFIAVSSHAADQGRRRVLEGESVPNQQKIFSVYEPDTELIKRGKTPNPIQFGHRVLLFEDAVGFVCHYRIVPLKDEERQIVADEFDQLQQRLGGKVQSLSLDKGFHSPANQERLASLVTHPCIPSTARKDLAEPTVVFRQARRRHPGVESTIGALQSGNGLKRCRDHSRLGFDRYVGLGILGRNLHVLGKLLIATARPDSPAAASKRKPPLKIPA